MKKILILAANPTDTNKLRLDEEVRSIETAHRQSKYREKIKIISKWGIRVDDLRGELLYHKPNIVHFCGHGEGDKGLVLENQYGQKQFVSSESLGELFKLFENDVECVVLNACYSEVQAEAIHQHINCLIGMNQAIGDKAAIKFATGFYEALANGRNYQDSFDFGRNAIDLQSIPESQTPQIKIRDISQGLLIDSTDTKVPCNKLRYANLFQLINILNNYFYVQQNDILFAYNLSLPYRLIDKEKNPQDGKELINGLQLPQQQDTYSYIDKFVGYLILLLKHTVSVELKRELIQWAESNIKDCGQLIQQLTSELDKKEQQYYPGLLVAISEREGGYVVEAWLNKNIAQSEQYSSSNFEQITINQEAVIATDETLSNVPELLKQMIAQSFIKYQKYLKQIHLFLPAKLMNHAVDGWKNWQNEEDDDEYSTTIGDDYEVLLRCSERLRGNSPPVIKWRDKAYIFKSKMTKPAEESFILGNHDNPKSLFKQLKLDDEVLAVKITKFFQQKEPGTLLWKAAVPIALWVRKQFDQSKNQSVLDKIIQDCCLEKVPNKVKQERCNAFDCDPPESHIGRHLCLLWDDPNLLPPEQIVTQNKL